MNLCFVVRAIWAQRPHYTTTHLAYEAHRKGHFVVYTTPGNFSYTDDQRVLANVIVPGGEKVTDRETFLDALNQGEKKPFEVCLSEFDVVFLRQNLNTFDSDPLPARNLLMDFGHVLKSQGVAVLNDPLGLERAASKIYLSAFPTEIRAQTLITRSVEKTKAFLIALDKSAILKPLRGFGGQDVFFVKSLKERNINQIISTVSKSGYVLVQEYLPAVRYGDKRLLMMGGRPLFVGKQPAIYRRMSPKGEFRSNMHVGGERKRCDFTDTDAKIAEAIGPQLVQDGLYFVGVDIVGDKLLEVNVFCPGGVHNINELYDVNVGEKVIEDLEQRTLQAGKQILLAHSN